jgi:anaerobic magnesium-protoporphyrin IX monomethyl ester cyclase
MGADVVLLETPFLSQTGREEVRLYVQSKYNLALVALGSYLRAHSRASVRIVNMVKDRIDLDALVADLRRDRPKVVGIPLYSYNLSYTFRVMTRIKLELPDVHLCVGGPHAAIYPRETLALAPVDSMVLGDGEVPFRHVVEAVVAGAAIERDRPSGLYTKGDLRTESFVAHKHEDLDDLPIPDITLLGDHTRYRDFLSDKVMGILTTSRGCPFVCDYCWSKYSNYRKFSFDRTIETMRDWRAKGVEYIEFWDETFNPNKKRLEVFADAMERADLGLQWAIRGAVVQHVVPETMARLERTGLRIIQFGVESFSKKTLAFLNKRIDRDMVFRAFETCRRANVRTVANMILNIPGQTVADIEDELKVLAALRPTYVSISIYNWAPGTHHYQQALDSGALPRDHWREHAGNPVGDDPIFHPDNGFASAIAYALRDRFVRRHYFNPRYVWNYLRMIDRSEIRPALSTGFLMSKGILKDNLDLSRLRAVRG